MSGQKKSSIARTAAIVPLLIIGLILINIAAVSWVGIEYYSTGVDDSISGEYFRSFNSYALQVAKGGVNPDEQILALHEALASGYSKLSSRLTEGTSLPEPGYKTINQKNEYSAALREHAIVVRDNMSGVVESTYLKIGIMLAISLIASLAMLVFVLFSRRAVKQYNSEISDGLSYIEKILNYEEHPNFQKKESGILEIQQINDAIYNLSNDINYNRKLVDTAFHGNLDQIMSDIFESICKRMPCDRAALAFIDTDGNCTAETAVTSYANMHLRPGYRVPLSSTSLINVKDSDQPRIINDLDDYASKKEISEATDLVMKEGLKSSITVPMTFDGKCLGFFFVSSREKNVFDNSMMNYVSRVINLMKQKLYIEYLLQEVISETSNAFVGLMEEKDNETSVHIQRMSQYSYIIARSYHSHIARLQPRFMREILWYAPLHDIGKVGTPDSILLKEGPLTNDEMKIMKQHVLTGIKVIEKMDERLHKIVTTPLLRTAVEIISGHHEKFDGNGYPYGLKGEDIPLAGRIVSLADVFDALTSRRPYKEAFSIEEALEIIDGDMNASFDPNVVKAFRLELPEIRRVYEKLKET